MTEIHTNKPVTDIFLTNKGGRFMNSQLMHDKAAWESFLHHGLITRIMGIGSIAEPEPITTFMNGDFRLMSCVFELNFEVDNFFAAKKEDRDFWQLQPRKTGLVFESFDRHMYCNACWGRDDIRIEIETFEVVQNKINDLIKITWKADTFPDRIKSPIPATGFAKK